MTRTDGPYQRRIYAVWDGDRSPWPATQDGTFMPAKCIPEYRELKPYPKSIDPTIAPTFQHFTFKRKRVREPSSNDVIEAIICDGIIVEPKHLRGIQIDA